MLPSLRRALQATPLQEKCAAAFRLAATKDIWEDVDLAKVNVERCVVEDSERQSGTLRLRAHPKNC
jgi:hypothetical protein